MENFAFYMAGLFLFISAIFMLGVYLAGQGLKGSLKTIEAEGQAFFQKLKNFISREKKLGYHFPLQAQSLLFKLLAFLRLRIIGPIYDSFRLSLRTLRIVIGTSDYKYKMPWYLMVSAEGLKNTALLQGSGLPNPIPSPNFGLPELKPALEWWFFEQAIVLEVSADTLADKNPGLHAQWKDLLKALRHFRYKRPLDAIILTVSASTLLNRSASEPRFDLVRIATFVTQQLAKTEKYFGMRLPITVLITECEELPGFSGFCHELPAKALNEMMGWSSPYGTEQPYESSWAQEIISSIKNDIFNATLRIFSRADAGKYADDLMVLPSSMASLKEGLQDFLSVLMGEGNYKQNFSLQGVFLTGKNEDESRIPQFFIKDFLSVKIFNQVGLAVPAPGYFKSAGRLVTLLKAALVMGVIAASSILYKGNQELTRLVEVFSPCLLDIVEALQEGQTKDIEGNYNALALEKRGRSVLALMEQFYENRLWIPYLFPSWYSYHRSVLRDSITRLYEKAVKRDLQILLRIKAYELLLKEAPQFHVDHQVLDPTSTPEFLVLEGYVDALLKLDKMQVYYNLLEESRSMTAFSDLISYLYGYKFKPGFFNKHPQAKDLVLGGAPLQKFDLNNFKLSAEKKLYSLYNAFLKRILDPEYNYALAQSLQSTLQQIENTPDWDAEGFRKTVSEIHSLMTFLTNSSGAWLTGATFDPGSRYQHLLQKLQDISIFNKDLVTRLGEVSKVLYDQATKYLLSYGSPLTGNFLIVSNEQNRLVPSPGLIALEKGLNELLEQPFMQKVSGQPFKTDLPPQQYMYWNPESLKSSLALIEDYKNFMKDNIGLYPAGLQNTLHIVGRSQTGSNISAMLGRAQTFIPQPVYSWGTSSQEAAQMHMNNITEVTPLLISLLKELQSINARDPYIRLKGLLLKQMFSLLALVDAGLQESSFYTSSDPNFQRWSGGKDAMLSAYTLVDQPQMQSYFDNQTSQIISLILEYAGPLIEFFKSDNFDLNVEQIKLITKWDSLLRQAVSFQKSKAAPSINILKNFMETEGNVITGENCLVALSPQTFNAESSDYFIQKRNEIMRRMYVRCEKLTAQKGAQLYNQVASFFNDNLAMLFPFMDKPPETSRIEGEASWEMMTRLFELLNGFTPEVLSCMEKEFAADPQWKNSKDFLSQILSVRDFFLLYFAPRSKGEPPSVKFFLNFNVNQFKSNLNQNVTDWAFLNGTKALSFAQDGNNLNVEWVSGKPVSFGFQWSVQSPLQQAEKPSLPALVKLGGRSLFIYEGAWSLLRAIMIHRATPEEGGNLNNTTILKFAVPMSDSPQGAPLETALLFDQIQPQTVGGTSATDFRVPQFPVKAPLFRVSPLL